MYVLEELWNGKVRPSERRFLDGSKYAELMSKGTALENAFYNELSTAGKKVYREHYENQMQLCDISEQDAFVRGVRFGARFMLDVVGEYHSQLPQIDEVKEEMTN